ncbi:hypothetical protein [Ancylobacter oerskovii]|uniref:Uncharacterized protein n=1 Tax=Ancylobacter oerskovii TaxID=459519 RepID=A0ABW4Z331_9HYPH|nr:hypothetical protein [Ancylobacter oerskovii]MBS7546277.1 hypothetical protein [Ancylobacter oerskovii]
MPEALKAGVQYGDWDGTVAADNGDQGGIHDHLREKGLLRDDEALLAIRFHSGSTDGIPWVDALVLRAAGFDGAKQILQQTDTPTLYQRKFEPTLQEFFSLFKRFNIVLTISGQNLSGREFDIVQED